MLKIFNKILLTFAIISMQFAFWSCSNDMEQVQNDDFANKKQTKEYLERANRYMVSQEKEKINDYIVNHKLDMVETGTGLRYRIVNQGDGDLIKKGNIVALDYELRLWDGTLIYSSEENGKKVFMVGHGGVESGLEEAVSYLHKGDEAEIIIPSHLAYGLLGDGDKIPPKATIVYKVKVVENQIIN